MPEIDFAHEPQPIRCFLCVASSVTTGAGQSHAAKSDKKQNPYEKLKELAADSSELLPNAFAFVLWPPLKVSEPKHPP